MALSTMAVRQQRRRQQQNDACGQCHGGMTATIATTTRVKKHDGDDSRNDHDEVTRVTITLAVR